MNIDGRVAALPEASDAVRRRSLASAVVVVAVACILAGIVSWPGFATQNTMAVTSEAQRS